MTYRYRAISKSGEYIEDVFRAESEFEVLQMIKNKDWLPISIKKNTNLDIQLSIFHSKIKKRDLAIFCRQFYAMVDGGIEILECLEVLGSQTKNKKIKNASKLMSENIQKGYSLSKAMQEHTDIFPVILINMLEVGEVSGNLDLILKRMSIYFEKEYILENKIKSSLIYPTILVGLSGIVLTFLLTIVFPIFLEIFEYSELTLPWATRFILNLGLYLIKYRYIILGILILVMFIIGYYSKTHRVKKFIHKFKIEFFIIKKINRNIVTSRFTRTISILLSSGIPMLRSIEITSRIIDNLYVKEKLVKGEEYIRRGWPLSKVINDMDIFPPMVSSMIGVGETSGALDDLLHKTADFYDMEIETDLQRLTILIEPILLILMSIFIGFIVLAIVLPIFDMINTI